MLVVALALVGAARRRAARDLRRARRARRPDRSPTRVPFCPLPADLEALIAAGLPAGRSPDVIGGDTAPVTSAAGVDPATRAVAVDVTADTRVPLVFLGRRRRARARSPTGLALDRIAPTLGEILGLRSAASRTCAPACAVTGVARRRPAPPGGGDRLERRRHAELGRAPGRRRGLRSGIDGRAAPARSTASTGLAAARPRGRRSRRSAPAGRRRSTASPARSSANDAGEVEPAWGAGAPISVIATLPDDLDRATRRAIRIGLVVPAAVRPRARRRHLVPRPRSRRRPRSSGDDPVAAVGAMLAAGFGADDTPDVLGVVLDGPVATIDRTHDGHRRPACAGGRPGARSSWPATGRSARRRAGDVRLESRDDVDAAIGAPSSRRRARRAVPGPGASWPRTASRRDDVRPGDGRDEATRRDAAVRGRVPGIRRSPSRGTADGRRRRAPGRSLRRGRASSRRTALVVSAELAAVAVVVRVGRSRAGRVAAELPDRLRLAARGGDCRSSCWARSSPRRSRSSCRRRRSRGSAGCRARCSCRRRRSPGSRSRSASADRCRWRAGWREGPGAVGGGDVHARGARSSTRSSSRRRSSPIAGATRSG